MTVINQTGNVGAPPETRPVTDRPEREERRTTTPSGYLGVEASVEVAASGEVSRPDLNKLTRVDHERFKAQIASTERTLRKAQQRLQQLKIRWSRNDKGLTQSVAEVSSFLKSKGAAALLDELKNEFSKYQSLRTELESKVAHEGPKVSGASLSSEVAVKILSRYANGAPEAELRNPVKAREIIFKNLGSKLNNLKVASKKVQAEQEKWRQKTGTAEEQQRAAKILSVLQEQDARLGRSAAVVEQAMQQAEASLRVLEGDELDLNPDDVEEGTNTGATAEAASTEENSATVASESVSRSGRGGNRPLGLEEGEVNPYEQGYSDYVDVGGKVGIASAAGPATTGISSVDLTGTTLAVMQSTAENRQQVQRQGQKLKRVLDQLIKRLENHDYNVLEICMIVVAQQLQYHTADVAVKVVKALDALDKGQKGIIDMMNKANTNDPSFSAKIGAANIQANQISGQRTTMVGFLRDMTASLEEAQNIAKSMQDIRGAQIRFLSKFNG